MTAGHTDDRGWGLPCTLVIGEATLAADLITQLIFKHLEQTLELVQAASSMNPLVFRTSEECKP